MDFLEIARARQSCRSYDTERPVEQEKLDAVLEAARLAPSACNAQPYHFTVCRGQAAKAAVAGVTGMGMNKFAAQAPVLIVISERPYSKSAALGSKVTKVDYRSIDIGIAAAYLTAEAVAQGLSTCIIGWLASYGNCPVFQDFFRYMFLKIHQFKQFDPVTFRSEDQFVLFTVESHFKTYVVKSQIQYLPALCYQLMAASVVFILIHDPAQL